MSVCILSMTYLHWIRTHPNIFNYLWQVFMLAHNKLMIDNNMSFDEAKVEMQHTWRSIVRTNLMEHLFDNDVLAEIQQDGYVNKFYT